MPFLFPSSPVDDYDIDSAREHLRFAAPFEGSLGVGNHDAHRLSSFVREMAVRSLLPSLEGRIRALNHQVRLSPESTRDERERGRRWGMGMWSVSRRGGHGHDRTLCALKDTASERDTQTFASGFASPEDGRSVEPPLEASQQWPAPFSQQTAVLPCSLSRGAFLWSRAAARLNTEASCRCVCPVRLRPHLYASLVRQVSLSRKGLRNQLKSFLWRKTTSSSEADPGNLTGQSGSSSSTQSRPYGATSLALEMRQLADLALMVGDTETALSTLRLVATDFRAERAKRHYAAAQEAIGVAMALSGAPAVEAAAPIKDAFFRYSQLSVAGSGTAPTASLRAREALRSATRAALFAMHVLRLGGAANEASYVAMKSHFQEDNVRAGLLLEQAAHYLLACHPPQTRKFAFHLVLAALRYKLCDQAILARYTYRCGPRRARAARSGPFFHDRLLHPD